MRAAVELLRSPSSLRTREQTEQLREVLQRRIEDARRADPSAGYAAHLRTPLDYRDWFRFHTFVVEDAAPGRRRKLTGRTDLSQGEQRVLSYLVLFAAAAAHFTSLAESAPHAPRLILLDDAFAKVDEPVVEAAADAACVQPLVCTSGSAATVVFTLLDALATTGCRFAYHGDFDWPGITLANRVIRRYEARPWRMGTADYEHLAVRSQAEGIPQLALDGQPVDADWDPDLAHAMTALGVALHEEATLELLVDDLSRPA